MTLYEKLKLKLAPVDDDDAVSLGSMKGYITSQAIATGGVTQKVFTITGDGTTTSFPFTHNFGTKDITWTMFDSATDEKIVAPVELTDENTITVNFGVAPDTGETFTLIVRGVQAAPAA